MEIETTSQLQGSIGREDWATALDFGTLRRDQSTSKVRRHILLGAAAVGALTLIYTLLYWNRFLAPSAGATSFYAAEQILQGKMPYRDFLFLTPPLHALKIAFLINLFGDKLVVPRLDGMIERVILALIIYFWLVRFFRTSATILGTFFGVLVFSGDGVDTLANYHHDSVFWAVLAGFLASFCLERRSSRALSLLAGASGLFAGLCFATKQTTGLGVLVAIPTLIALLILRHGKWGDAGRFVCCWSAGWLLPLGALLIWLFHGGALALFFRSVFMAGSSKGSLYNILSRPFNQDGILFTEVAIATVTLGVLITRFRDKGKPDSISLSILFTSAATVAVALAVISIYTSAMWPGSLHFPEPLLKDDHFRAPLLSVLLTLLHWGTMLVPITGGLLIVFYLSVSYIRGRLRPEQSQLLFLAGLSVAVSYMLALSWQTYCPMALPGVALVVTVAIDRLESYSPFVACILASTFCFLIYSYVGNKLLVPYVWMNWSEPRVNLATHQPALLKLRGLLLSEPTLSDVETITDLILTHSSPSDTLLVYPYFPVFYVLTDRRPPTYAFNHYLDVAPDAISKLDAQKLRSDPPAVLVYMKVVDEEVQKDERIFRAGKPSGSREIVQVIEALAVNYHRLYTIKVPGTPCWIYVCSKN